MEVKGPGKAGSVGKTGKAGGPTKTGDASFGNLVDAALEAGGASETGGIGGVAGVSSVDALIAAQGADDASTGGGGNRRAKMRGDMLLDTLDQLRIGLLRGAVNESVLHNLTRMAKAQRDQISDPQLLEIINEIDMRAQIELAKFERDRQS